MTFSTSEVRAYYSARVPKLKNTTQKELRGPCPVHQGKDPNFAVDAETGLAHCFSACGRGWDMIALEQELTGLDFPRAKERVYELVGRPRVPWEERNVTHKYEYTDANGNVLYEVLRYVGKEFKQRRPDGNGGWTWGLGSIARVPFRLQKFASTDFLVIVEGEKDALTLERLGLVGTCNNGGAARKPGDRNFRPELVPHFTGKHVAIIPDNDDPGRSHALSVAELVAPVAKSVKIIELPDLPPKGDVTDWVNAGGTKDALRELYRKAQPWTPDFEFSANIPDENDQYVGDTASEVEASGGLTEFWNLSRLSGLETPWPKLSRAMGGGLRRGEMYIIGANQGAGKSSLALQFMIAAMRRREGCLLFSMEMGRKAVCQRMAAIETRINLNDLQDAQFVVRKGSSTPADKAESQKIVDALMPPLARMTSDLAQYPHLVSTKSSITPEYIVEETRRLSKRMKIQLVIVDHMQLMSATGSIRGDYEKFTAISRAMKQTAVDIDVPVLVLSQTSRAQSKDKRTELEVSDLRGSGALEEDAAGVMLLYEDAEDRNLAMSEGPRYTQGPVKCWLKLGKNRYGEQGKRLELMHTKTCTRFDPPEELA